MTATGPAIMEVDPGSVAGTAVDRFHEEPLARGLNGETAVDRFLDEPSDWGPAGETAVDRSLDTANIADDGHRPIQLAWHGKLVVQGEDVSTSTAKKRVVTPTLGAAIVLEKVLRTACARRVGRRRGPTATVIVRGMDGIGILRMWIIYGVSIAIRIQNGCGV